MNMKCGCENCKWFKTYLSYNYYEPDDYECYVSKDYLETIDISDYTDEQFDIIMDKVWSDGEMWDEDDKPIWACPFYKRK